MERKDTGRRIGSFFFSLVSALIFHPRLFSLRFALGLSFSILRGWERWFVNAKFKLSRTSFLLPIPPPKTGCFHPKTRFSTLHWSFRNVETGIQMRWTTIWFDRLFFKSYFSSKTTILYIYSNFYHFFLEFLNTEVTIPSLIKLSWQEKFFGIYLAMENEVIARSYNDQGVWVWNVKIFCRKTILIIKFLSFFPGISKNWSYNSFSELP